LAKSYQVCWVVFGAAQEPSVSPRPTYAHGGGLWRRALTGAPTAGMAGVRGLCLAFVTLVCGCALANVQEAETSLKMADFIESTMFIQLAEDPVDEDSEELEPEGEEQSGGLVRSMNMGVGKCWPLMRELLSHILTEDCRRGISGDPQLYGGTKEDVRKG
jgi:hypothetical protein